MSRVTTGHRVLLHCECPAVRVVLKRESRITEGTVRGLCECGGVARVLDADILGPVPPRPVPPPHRPEVREGEVTGYDLFAVGLTVGIAAGILITELVF